jgi:adenine-specific DNA-methyltransferase
MTSSVTGETPDGHHELLVQLRDLVPSAFLDGELNREALLDALGLGDDAKPAFAFTWPGIDRGRQDARAATSATLVPDEDASLGWESARDVLIEGDNLQVLKLLKNGYSRTVKLIYIDPPYNTGDTFTYNDDFAVPESQYLTDTGQVDEQGTATTSRIETGGRRRHPCVDRRQRGASPAALARRGLRCRELCGQLRLERWSQERRAADLCRSRLRVGLRPRLRLPA